MFGFVFFVFIFFTMLNYSPQDGAVENYTPDLWDNTLR